MDSKMKSSGPDFRRKSAAPGLASPGSEELVASSPSQRNWRGIGIALLVILAVCSLIVTAVVLLTPGDTGPRVKGERLTLEDFLEDNFTTLSFNGTWVSETEFVYRSKSDELLLYDAEVQNTTVLIPSEPFRRANPQLYFLSPDRKYVLFVNGIHKVFRHTFIGIYSIYDVAENVLTFLGPEPPREDILQYAQWGPVGNSLVFVFENNVYYKASATSNATKLTGSRLEDAVFNGIPDWIYEEEILSSDHALWFSNDGSLLCIASFNDSLVPAQPFEWFGSPKSPLLYPKPDFVKYPKPATPNPSVQLFIFNVTNLLPDVIFENVLTPPFSLLEEEHYFTAVTWASDTELSVIWMNRRQNLSIVSICSPPLWFCNESYREETRQAGWVDWYEPPLFSSDGQNYLLRGAINDGDAGAFRQVVLKNVHDRNPKVLTMGKWEVTKIDAYDEQNKLVYYTAAPEKSSGERHLYRISSTGAATNKSGYCLTCHLAPDCLYNSAKFSFGASYYVLDCLGPNVPKRYLFESITNKQLALLEGNEAVEEVIATRALPQVRTFRVGVDGDYGANVRLLLPPELREDEVTQYPLIVNVYGGPGSQLVDEKFNIGWGNYLASNKSYIYAMIDGRGSGFQGEKRKFELYRRLGSVEVEDQIAVTKYLTEKLLFIDKKKIAMWGWSYGGYVTAKVMATDVDVFKCGISVAPVTSWNFYDSVYTERYMGFPTADDNGDGYARADVLKLASNFKKKEYYLIHGTADDNVHVQQSMLLSSALAQAEVIFRQQVYPDENHALYGVQRHLYLSMADFLEDCFHEIEVSEIGLQALDSNKDDGEGNEGAN